MSTLMLLWQQASPADPIVVVAAGWMFYPVPIPSFQAEPVDFYPVPIPSFRPVPDSRRS